MTDHWREIATFPGYSVSTSGRIRNDSTERIMRTNVNQRGIVYVGLMRRGIQHKQSVPILVAEAHLPDPDQSAFDSPIHLDGNRENNDASNLLWRPRWFAIMYQQQFGKEPRPLVGPIVEINTGEEFESTWEAATTHGLIDMQIRTALRSHEPVWPTQQEFRKIE